MLLFFGLPPFGIYIAACTPAACILSILIRFRRGIQDTDPNPFELCNSDKANWACKYPQESSSLAFVVRCAVVFWSFDTIAPHLYLREHSGLLDHCERENRYILFMRTLPRGSLVHNDIRKSPYHLTARTTISLYLLFWLN